MNMMFNLDYISRILRSFRYIGCINIFVSFEISKIAFELGKKEIFRKIRITILANPCNKELFRRNYGKMLRSDRHYDAFN